MDIIALETGESAQAASEADAESKQPSEVEPTPQQREQARLKQEEAQRQEAEERLQRFFELVKSINEAKSKQEEEGHDGCAERGSMLGHDSSFGHIHAVKLTRAAKLADKLVGGLHTDCTRTPQANSHDIYV